jgi:hypothetical protein
MIFDLIAGSGTSGPPPWTPADLFKNGEQGWWLDASDMSTLFQDYQYTTPVTASGQPVGAWKNKLTGQPYDFNLTNATSSQLPLLEIASGKSNLVFDGVDDYLQWAATIPDPYGLNFNGEYGEGYGIGFMYASSLSDLRLFDWWTSSVTVRVNQFNVGNQLLGGYTTSSNAPSEYPASNSLVASGSGSQAVSIAFNGVVNNSSSVPYQNAINIASAKFPYTQDTTQIRISQFIHINRALTPEERDQLEAFIRSKQ